MKQLFALLVGGLCAFTQASALALSPAVPASATASPIRAAAAVDATLPKLKVEEKLLQGFSAEGTTVTAYLASGKIVKIEAVALGERGRSLFDFYWRGNTLVAAHERRIDYGAMITAIPVGQPLPLNVVLDEWVELRRGRAFQRFVGGETVSSSTKEAESRARELTGVGRSFLRFIHTSSRPASDGCHWSCSKAWNPGCATFVCQ